MKYLYTIILFVFLAKLNLLGQNTNAIGVSFGTTSYYITHVQEYKESPAGFLSDDLSFFYEQINQNDYQKYRTYYYNNSCLIGEEDFKNWRAHFNPNEVTPVARYLAYSDKDTLCIISYTMGSANEQQYFSCALQKKNNRWYLLDLRKSEEMMGFKMFLAFVNPTFIGSFLDRPDEMKAKYMSTIFTAKGNLNGDQLMNYYEERYNPSSVRYSLSRETFHSTAILSQSNIDRITSEINNLAEEYNIPAAKKVLLDQMSAEGNYSMAINKIAEWSVTSDVIEITEKFHSGIDAAAKKN